MRWEISDYVRGKADGYVQNGRVSQDPEHPNVWWVQGGAEKPYRVQTDATTERPRMTMINCTCKYGMETGSGLVVCSHAVAVAKTIVDNLDSGV